MGPMEVLGPQKRFMFVLIDYTSHWIQFKFSQNTNTTSLISFLENAFFLDGIPSTLFTDNGVQFTSDAMRAFLERFDIKHERTALYCPKANGMVERANRMLKDHIQLAITNNLRVEESLKEWLWAYHTTPNLITGVSPFVMLRGREPSTKMNPQWLEGGKTVTPDLKSSQNKVQRHQEMYKYWYDKKHGVKDHDFQVGSPVAIKRPTHVQPGLSKYLPPQRVTKKGKNVVQLDNGQTWSGDRLVEIS